MIPKGQSLESYIQDDMTKLTNHINSTTRASLNGRNPFELAQLLSGQKLLDGLDLESIHPDKIILKPQLLK